MYPHERREPLGVVPEEEAADALVGVYPQELAHDDLHGYDLSVVEEGVRTAGAQPMPSQDLFDRFVHEALDGYNELVQVHGSPPSVGFRPPSMVEELVGLDQKNLHIGLTSYVERYMAKPEEFPEGLQTGRIWGIWNEDYLPVRWETAEVSLRDAFRIRRIYRRLAKRKGSGSLRRITVFIRHENVVRLLEFLGYQLE